jgi:ribonucleoside-diphosphate reductase beta chain
MLNDDILTVKNLYNPDSDENINEALVFGGNPSGLVDLENTNHKHAKGMMDASYGRSWYTNKHDLSKDKVRYKNLTKAEQMLVKNILAQLSLDDSLQTDQLMTRISPFITSPAIKAGIAFHAKDEAIHSATYAKIIKEVIQDTSVYRQDLVVPELMNKNLSVRKIFDDAMPLSSTIRKSNMIKMIAANIGLESLVFPSGFVGILSLATKIPGTANFISEIVKDELINHVPFFIENFKIAKKENPDLNWNKLENEIKNAVHELVTEEIKWGTFIGKNTLYLSEDNVATFIQDRANRMLRQMGFSLMYDLKGKHNPLLQFLKIGTQAKNVETAVFELISTNYNRNNITS